MLNLASRIAAALTKTNPAAHPRRPSDWRPQENERMAGAMPNEMTSASESNSTPNALALPVSRAMQTQASPKADPKAES